MLSRLRCRTSTLAPALGPAVSAADALVRVSMAPRPRPCRSKPLPRRKTCSRDPFPGPGAARARQPRHGRRTDADRRGQVRAGVSATIGDRFPKRVRGSGRCRRSRRPASPGGGSRPIMFSPEFGVEVAGWILGLRARSPGRVPQRSPVRRPATPPRALPGRPRCDRLPGAARGNTTRHREYS